MRLAFRLLTLLWVSTLILSGCGYGLVNVQDEEKRQGEVVRAILVLRSDLRKVQEKLSALDQSTEQRLQQANRSVKDLQKHRADLDSRVDEMGLNLRLMQGSLEKRDHRVQEIAQQLDAQDFRIQNIVSLEKKLSGDLGTQQRQVSDLASKVEELSKNVPPLLADQAEHLKALSKNLEAYSNQGASETEQLSKSLTSLSQALDLLGQKITSKVDNQDKSILKMAKRLESVEARLGKKKPRKSGSSGGSPDASDDATVSLTPLFYRVGEISYSLGDLRGAWEAYGAAVRISRDGGGEVPEWTALALLRQSEVAADMGETDPRTVLEQLVKIAERYPTTAAGKIARRRIELARTLWKGEVRE
jgi:uncharacterized protein YoxC